MIRMDRRQGSILLLQDPYLSKATDRSKATHLNRHTRLLHHPKALIIRKTSRRHLLTLRKPNNSSSIRMHQIRTHMRLVHVVLMIM